MKPFVSLLLCRRVGIVALILALLLSAPLLGVGPLLDDYLHEEILRGDVTTPTPPKDLFSFARGGPGLERGVQLGQYPWWTHPDLHCSFLRPLSTALVHLDRALFGDAWWLRHLHSIAWCLLLVGGAAALYRRVLPQELAGAAVILFAVRASHGAAVYWLSARDGIVAAACTVWALVAWLRWRQEGWRWGIPLAAFWGVAGLAGGEVSSGAPFRRSPSR